jgi:hypothetical protein
MATNALPAGTRNTSLNLIDEEYQVLLNISGGKLGPFIKDTFLRGLREVDAKAAKQIQDIRNERLRMKHGIICLLVGALSLGCAFAGKDFSRGIRVRSRKGREEMACNFHPQLEG